MAAPPDGHFVAEPHGGHLSPSHVGDDQTGSILLIEEHDVVDDEVDNHPDASAVLAASHREPIRASTQFGGAGVGFDGTNDPANLSSAGHASAGPDATAARHHSNLWIPDDAFSPDDDETTATGNETVESVNATSGGSGRRTRPEFYADADDDDEANHNNYSGSGLFQPSSAHVRPSHRGSPAASGPVASGETGGDDEASSGGVRKRNSRRRNGSGSSRRRQQQRQRGLTSPSSSSTSKNATSGSDVTVSTSIVDIEDANHRPFGGSVNDPMPTMGDSRDRYPPPPHPFDLAVDAHADQAGGFVAFPPQRHQPELLPPWLHPPMQMGPSGGDPSFPPALPPWLQSGHEQSAIGRPSTPEFDNFTDSDRNGSASSSIASAFQTNGSTSPVDAAANGRPETAQHRPALPVDPFPPGNEGLIGGGRPSAVEGGPPIRQPSPVDRRPPVFPPSSDNRPPPPDFLVPIDHVQPLLPSSNRSSSVGTTSSTPLGVIRGDLHGIQLVDDTVSSAAFPLSTATTTSTTAATSTTIRASAAGSIIGDVPLRNRSTSTVQLIGNATSTSNNAASTPEFDVERNRTSVSTGTASVPPARQPPLQLTATGGPTTATDVTAAGGRGQSDGQQVRRVPQRSAANRRGARICDAAWMMLTG